MSHIQLQFLGSNIQNEDRENIGVINKDLKKVPSLGGLAEVSCKTTKGASFIAKTQIVKKHVGQTT